MEKNINSEDNVAADSNGNIAWEVYNGGRALNSILYSSLKPPQRLVLIAITSQMDFTSNFKKLRWMPIKLIAKLSGFTNRHVTQTLSSLVSDGYLLRKPRFNGSKQLANNYALTNKIFNEYETYLRDKDQGCKDFTPNPPTPEKISGMGAKRFPPSPEKISSELPLLAPSKELPHSSFSEKKQKEKKEKPNSKSKDIRDAIGILSLIYSNNGKFFDQDSIRQAANTIVTRWGLAPLLLFQDWCIENQNFGKLEFNANDIFNNCARLSKQNSESKEA